MDAFISVKVSNEPIGLDEAYAFVHTGSAGAVLCFVGTVRDHFGGRPVTGVQYEAYQEMAEKELSRIAHEACRRWPELRTAIYHRTGYLPVGERSLIIAVSSPHREAAYAASRFLIEEIKIRTPIWKKEHFADGKEEWHDEPKRP